MTEILDFLRRAAEDAGGTVSALGLLLRVTVLLAAAILAALALRRSSAAVRHLLWALALAGTLLAPLCYCGLPAWHWAVLPPPQAAPPIAPVVESAPPAPVPEDVPSPPVRPTFRPPRVTPPTPMRESFAPPATASAAAIADHPLPPAPSRPARPAWSWPLLLAAVWAAGSALGFVWLVVGIVVAWRFARSARSLTDSRWHPVLRQLLDERGAGRAKRTHLAPRDVAVRECPHVPVPMTWGLRRPVILVPAGSAAWPEEVQRSVLLHELGHIRRGDCLTLLLGRAACATYWFHPLVWLAGRQLRKTAEQAADDLVLSASVAPPDYAGHLVEIASHLRRLRLLGRAALPITGHSDLEGRVRAILDGRRNRRGLKRTTFCALTALALLLAVPCSLLRLGHAQPRPAAASFNPEPAATAMAATSVAAPKAASADSAKKLTVSGGTFGGTIAGSGTSNASVGGGTLVISAPTFPSAPPPVRVSANGKVLDVSGKPVAGASVYLRQQGARPYMQRDPRNAQPRDILAECQTDPRGEFRFLDVLARTVDAENWALLYAWCQRHHQTPWDVVVIAPGSALAWRHLTAPQQGEPIVFQLQPEAKITGRITDEKGRPLEGVDVAARLISSLRSELFDFTQTPELLDLRWSRLAVRTKSDADGRVVLHGLPPQRRLWLDLEREGWHRPWWLIAATTEQPQSELRGLVETPLGEWQPAFVPVHSGSFTAVLQPARRIAGTVVDGGTGKPLPGINVIAMSVHFDQQYLELLPEPPWAGTPTDQAGRFALSDMPQSTYSVSAIPQKIGPCLVRQQTVAFPRDRLEMDLRIELPRGEPLAGRVVDKKGGKGVAGYAVNYSGSSKPGGDGLFASEPVTDRDGRFRFTVPPGKGTVEVWPPDPSPIAVSPRPPLPKENVQQVDIVAGRPHPDLLFSITPTAGNGAGNGVSFDSGASFTASNGNSSAEETKALLPPFAHVRPPIEGKVLGPDGHPVAGAVVGLMPWFASHIEIQHYTHGRHVARISEVDEKVLAKRFVRTDAAGRFALRDLDVDEWGAIQAVQAERHLIGIVDLPNRSRLGVLEIFLSPAGSVSGIARKEDGGPCAGVDIRIEETPLKVIKARSDATEPHYETGAVMDLPSPLNSFEASTQTDAQGRFRFATVPAGKQFTLQATGYDPGYACAEKNPQTVRVKPGENVEVPPFVYLLPRDSVAGRVVDSQGKPVAGAVITAYNGRGPIDGGFIITARPATTAADGRFTITGLPRIPVTLNVSVKMNVVVPGAPGPQPYQHLTRVRVQPGQKDVRIEVKPPSWAETKR